MGEGEESTSPIYATLDKTEYQSSYVEDFAAVVSADGPPSVGKLASPVESDRKSPSSSSPSPAQRRSFKSCLKGASTVSVPDYSLPQGPGSSEDGGRALEGMPEEASSGSKTVKFRPMVRIRHSHTRRSSNAPSQVEFREAEVEVGDGSAPPGFGLDKYPRSVSERSRFAAMSQDVSCSESPSEGGEIGPAPRLPVFDHVADPESSTRFSRGVFGGGFGLGSRSPAEHDVGPGRGAFAPLYGETSKFDEGYPRGSGGVYGDFAVRASSHQDSSSFRSSRGAFSTDFIYITDDFGIDGRHEDFTSVSASLSPGYAANGHNPGEAMP